MVPIETKEGREQRAAEADDDDDSVFDNEISQIFFDGVPSNGFSSSLTGGVLSPEEQEEIAQSEKPTLNNNSSNRVEIEDLHDCDSLPIPIDDIISDSKRAGEYGNGEDVEENLSISISMNDIETIGNFTDDLSAAMFDSIGGGGGSSSQSSYHMYQHLHIHHQPAKRRCSMPTSSSDFKNANTNMNLPNSNNEAHPHLLAAAPLAALPPPSPVVGAGTVINIPPVTERRFSAPHTTAATTAPQLTAPLPMDGKSVVSENSESQLGGPQQAQQINRHLSNGMLSTSDHTGSTSTLMASDTTTTTTDRRYSAPDITEMSGNKEKTVRKKRSLETTSSDKPLEFDFNTHAHHNTTARANHAVMARRVSAPMVSSYCMNQDLNNHNNINNNDHPMQHNFSHQHEFYNGQSSTAGTLQHPPHHDFNVSPEANFSMMEDTAKVGRAERRFSAPHISSSSYNNNNIHTNNANNNNEFNVMTSVQSQNNPEASLIMQHHQQQQGLRFHQGVSDTTTNNHHHHRMGRRFSAPNTTAMTTNNAYLKHANTGSFDTHTANTAVEFDYANNPHALSSRSSADVLRAVSVDHSNNKSSSADNNNSMNINTHNQTNHLRMQRRFSAPGISTAPAPAPASTYTQTQQNTTNHPNTSSSSANIIPMYPDELRPISSSTATTTTTTSTITSNNNGTTIPTQQAPAVNFNKTMLMSQYSQQSLQDWDKKMGLSKAHSRTMIKSAKSRKRLQSINM